MDGKASKKGATLKPSTLSTMFQQEQAPERDPASPRLLGGLPPRKSSRNSSFGSRGTSSPEGSPKLTLSPTIAKRRSSSGGASAFPARLLNDNARMSPFLARNSPVVNPESRPGVELPGPLRLASPEHSEEAVEDIKQFSPGLLRTISDKKKEISPCPMSPVLKSPNTTFLFERSGGSVTALDDK